MGVAGVTCTGGGVTAPPPLFAEGFPVPSCSAVRASTIARSAAASRRPPRGVGVWCECSRQQCPTTLPLPPCSLRVKVLPQILVLHLKRFKYMEHVGRFVKLSYRVAFPFELKLFNTVSALTTPSTTPPPLSSPPPPVGLCSRPRQDVRPHSCHHSLRRVSQHAPSPFLWCAPLPLLVPLPLQLGTTRPLHHSGQAQRLLDHI